MPTPAWPSDLNRNGPSTFIYLDCLYEPACERVIDWAGHVGPYIVFNGRLNPSQIQRLLGGSRTPRTRNSRGQDVPNVDFTLHCTKCTGMPDWLTGVTPLGRYFPAVYIRGSNVVSLVNEPTECPHCAYLRATELLAQGTGVNADIHRPSVYFVGPVAAISEVEFAIELDGDGHISLSSDTTKIDFTERGCANCGFPGHTRAACTNQRHYNKIGVEIEGRFFNIDELTEKVEEDGLDITGDGSIRYGANPECEPREIRTKPDLLAGCLRQVAKFYPDEADYSCGMHVHVSFLDTASVSTLTCTEFLAYFDARWRAWGAKMQLPPNCQFYQRLDNKNDYCNKNDAGDLERPFSGDRYRQLNFTSWERHNTVECRLLPMFREARLALSAITELISIYEDWLNGDCDAHLPQTNLIGDVSPVTWADAKCVTADFESPSRSFASQIELAPLPPVPEGHHRIVLSATARRILLAALDAA